MLVWRRADGCLLAVDDTLGCLAYCFGDDQVFSDELRRNFPDGYIDSVLMEYCQLLLEESIERTTELSFQIGDELLFPPDSRQSEFGQGKRRVIGC